MPPTPTGPTVLVVDDEADIRESITALLEGAVRGAQVKVASSGAGGLDVLRSGPVDLIVTDYRMPEMNGLDFLARARAVAPGAPSIMITAFPDPEVAERATQVLGVKRYLLTPLDPQTLLDAVRQSLETAA